MTRTSRAWVMDVGAGWQVAAGAPHVVEYLLAPETIDVPRAPGHCAGLLIWRDQIIPVIDFAPPSVERRAPPAPPRRAVILAYQEGPAQALRFGALLVTAAPTEAWVSDDMAGPLTQMPALFRPVARACFVQQDRAIPILDTRRLFTRPLPPWRATHAAVSERLVQPVAGPRATPAPAAGGKIPRHLSVVQTLQEWKTSPRHALPVLFPGIRSDEMAAEPADDRHAAATPERLETAFAPDSPDAGASTAPLPIAPLETSDFADGVWQEEAVPAHTESVLSPFAESTAEFVDVDEAAPPVGVPHASLGATPRSSNSVQSFQRLHAIAQDIAQREHRHSARRGQRRGWLLGIGLLITLAGALLMLKDFSPAEPAAEPPLQSVARDVAPDGIDPALIPSTPAQPPQ